MSRIPMLLALMLCGLCNGVEVGHEHATRSGGLVMVNPVVVAWGIAVVITLVALGIHVYRIMSGKEKDRENRK